MKLSFSLFIAILQILLLCTPSSVWAQGAEPRFSAGQTFMLRITGVPQTDFTQISQTYTISNKGTVKFPYIKEVLALGLTPTELQEKVVAAYKAAEVFADPTVVIQTSAVPDLVITVGGEVATPGEVPFRPGCNLYSVICKAGGPTPYTTMKRVKLMRAGKETFYDLRKVSAENNPALQSGDQIVVIPN